jgi:hypothetical protein
VDVVSARYPFGIPVAPGPTHAVLDVHATAGRNAFGRHTAKGWNALGRGRACPLREASYGGVLGPPLEAPGRAPLGGIREMALAIAVGAAGAALTARDAPPWDGGSVPRAKGHGCPAAQYREWALRDAVEGLRRPLPRRHRKALRTSPRPREPQPDPRGRDRISSRLSTPPNTSTESPWLRAGRMDVRPTVGLVVTTQPCL